ncbi:MAG: hypothetical protein V3G42_11340 [Oscillospiraceae bacterium]
MMKWYMHKPTRITEAELSEMTGVTERTIRDMCAESSEERRFDLRFIVAVAIGLKMMPEHALEFVELDGYHLRRKKKEERFYKFFLHRSGKISVSECNRILKNHNLLPLTNCENEQTN